MPSNPKSAPCPACGQPLPYDAPQGRCPDCLFEMLESSDESDLPSEELSAQIFGDYELIEEIARGGMGVVYKARQISLGRIVALKMMLGGQFAARELIQRFRAEAGAAAALRHPNIVAIYDVGVHAGQHYFSMDYIEGQNLSQLVRARPLSPAQAARYLKLVAEAVHFAHQQGILHRDLKPSNVLVDSATDQPHVTDFGLAKRVDGEASLTLTGQVLGSPNFMPPEQANPTLGKIGRGSDVYSLGGVLYYLLTGRPPVQGETLESTIHQLINDEPVSPRLLNSAIPRDLETICLKCLEKDSTRRYASAWELAEELDRFLRDETILARPASRFEKVARWRRRKPALAAAIFTALLLLLVLVVGSPLAAYRINEARKDAIAEGGRAQSEAQRAEAGELSARKSAYAADMHLVRVAFEENNLVQARDLLDRHAPRDNSKIDLRGWEWRYLRGLWKSDELATLKSRTENSKWILTVGFSPNGRLLAAGSQDGKVTLWSIPDRRKVGELLHGGMVRAIAFSPRDSILATLSYDQFLRIWDLNTLSNVWRVPADIIPTMGRISGAVAFSPDGAMLATGGGSSLVVVSNLISKTQFVLDTVEPRVTEIAFSPDGQTLASRSNRGKLRLWNLADRTVNFALPHGGWGESSISFSPDGTKLASTSADRVLNLWDTRSGQLLKSATNRLGFPTSARFSANGKTLAIANSEHTITLRDVDSWNSLGELKGHLGPVSTIAYSPTENLIASGSDDGEVKLWTPLAAGKTAKGLTLYPHLKAALAPDFGTVVIQQTDEFFAVWDIASMTRVSNFRLKTDDLSGIGVGIGMAPGGKRLAFGTQQGLVKVLDLEGENLREQTSFNVGADIQNIAFSADGQQCAACGGGVVCLWDSRQRTELRRFEHAGVQKVTFSMDGRYLASASRNGTVKISELTGAKRVRELQPHPDVVVGLAFFPDGKTLATISWDRTAKLWDTETLELLTTLQGQIGDPTAIAVSPDATRVAVATSDGSVTLWVADRGQPMPVATLRGHSPYMPVIGFLPDGNTIVATGSDELLAWRAPTFAEIAAREKESSK